MPTLKEELLKVRASTGMSPEDFDAASIHTWDDVMRRIEAKFLVRTFSGVAHNSWWERLKQPQQRLYFAKVGAREHLPYLINMHDRVWYIAQEPFDYEQFYEKPNKNWLFEGTAEAVTGIISQYEVREYYLVSKKYDWFIGRKHHDELIGLGSVTARMQTLANQLYDVREVR